MARTLNSLIYSLQGRPSKVQKSFRSLNSISAFGKKKGKIKRTTTPFLQYLMPNMQHCCPPMSTVINGTPTKHALGNLSGLSEGPATTHCSRYYNTLSQSRTNPPSPFKCISHMHQRVLPVPMGEFLEASRAQPIHSKTSHKHPLKAQASGETAFGAGGDYFGARRIRRVWQLVRALAFSRGASEVS